MCPVKSLPHRYTEQRTQARLGNSVSKPFHVSNGARQGGVLRPYLFAVYFDGLSRQLQKVKSGCFVGNTRVNHLIFADVWLLFTIP